MTSPRSDHEPTGDRVLSGYGLGRLRSARANLLRQFCIIVSHNERKP